MADGADQRGLDAGQTTGNGFFVETPEILQRAAATGQDNGVKTGLVSQLQGVDNLRGGLLALHSSGYQHQVNVRCAPGKNTDDVANHRAAGRGDQPDTARMTGQGLFVFGSKQAFLQQLLLECFVSSTQGALASCFHLADNKLIITTTFINGQPAGQAYFYAVFYLLARTDSILSKESTADLCAGIL